MRKAIISLIVGLILVGFGAYEFLIPRRSFRPGNFTRPSNFTAYQGGTHYGFHFLRLLPLVLLVVGAILVIASIASLMRKT